MTADYRDLMIAAAKVLDVEPPAFVLPDDRYVTLNGLKFHYLDWGNDHLPHVVLLHGGGLTAHTWDLAALLLRDKYHVVAFDQRGHGDSDWTPSVEDDKYDYMPADLSAFIDFLGYDYFTLGGMSVGGLTAMRYAVHHPDRVGALVIVDIYPDMIRSGPYRVGRKPVTFGSFDDMLLHAGEIYTSQPPETLRYDVFHNARQDADGRWIWKEDRRPRPDQSGANKPRWERDTDDLLATLRVTPIPTLIMRGQHSRILSAEEMSRVSAMMQHARWIEIPNAGHAIQSHNPTALARELDTFLTEVLAKPAPEAEAAERA